MSRIILIGSFVALLAAGGTQSANAIESANQTAWAQAGQACAEVGIAPGSAGWVIGLLVGISMVFGGASLIAMALDARAIRP